MVVAVLGRLATLGPKPRATAEASPFLVTQWTQPQARSDREPQFLQFLQAPAARGRRGGASEPSPP